MFWIKVLLLELFVFFGETVSIKELQNYYFRFSQPPNSLFKKDEVDSVQTIFWQRMDLHAEFATIQYIQVDRCTDNTLVEDGFTCRVCYHPVHTGS